MKQQEIRVIHVLRGILTDVHQPQRVLIGLGKAYKWEIPGCLQPSECLDPIAALNSGLKHELGPEIQLYTPKLFRRLTETKKSTNSLPQLWFVDFYTAQLEGTPRVTNPQELRRIRWVTDRSLAQMHPQKFRYAHRELLAEILNCK
jgi:hypothetical protein